MAAMVALLSSNHAWAGGVLPTGAKAIGNSFGSLFESAFNRVQSEGLSYVSINPRTPTGSFYGLPLISSAPEGEGDAWQISTDIEVGGLLTTGTTDTASFQEYTDFSDGFVLNQLRVTAFRPSTGVAVSAVAGGIGRGDQYYSLMVRRAGDFNISGFFQSTPHVFATNARVLWDGVGTSSLTLPTGLVPGASSRTDVEAALNATGETRLALSRDKGGFAAQVTLGKALTMNLTLSQEKREGTRAFGAAFSYPTLGQYLETI